MSDRETAPATTGTDGPGREVVRPYGTDEATVAEAFRTGRVPVAVYGLGKMGLPIASVYADVSGNVTGVDADPAVVDTIESGDCHVEREPGLPQLVGDLVERGALRATTDGPRAAADAHVHVVIVPTLLTDDGADLSVVEDVVEDIAAGLSPGDLVVVESTVPPRTTRDRILPVLEAESDLRRGEFGLAFCPERTSSGRALQDIRGSYPKVVGGVDEESTAAAAAIYEQLVDNDVVRVDDATTAEFVKVSAGVFRDVNIAIANQLALYADEVGVNMRSALRVANTVPSCNILEPGPGVGGHCIPVYPYFLLEEFETDGRLLRTAREVNDGMHRHVADLVLRALGEQDVPISEATVHVLGVTYRANVAETRNTPAGPVVEALDDVGATVYATDPMVEDWSSFPSVRPISLAAVSPETAGPGQGTPLRFEGPDDVDVVVLLTAHEEFTRDVFRTGSFEGVPVVDTRGVLDPNAVENPVYTLGGDR